MSITDKTASCLLCPQHCQLRPGQTGRCHVRGNEGEGVQPLNYGEVAACHLDPIEKKPLFHFFPGSEIYSVAGYGCNLSCNFCQNYEISQSHQRGTKFTPASLAEQARDSLGLCFTYSEPSTWFEMIRDTAPLVQKNGGKVVLVSNGTIAPRFLEELIPFIDAVNIDIKGYSEEFYQKFCGGRLSWVLDTVERLASRVHLEVTTLVIPGANDRPEEIHELSRWLRKLNTPLAWHLSRYYPAYKLKVPPTERETLLHLWELAKEEVEYVYMGNVSGGETTFCPRCGKKVIIRDNYRVHNLLKEGHCPQCDKEIFGMGLR